MRPGRDFQTFDWLTKSVTHTMRDIKIHSNEIEGVNPLTA